MDGFNLAGSPGLSGITGPGNDAIKDYLSLINNSFAGIFSDGKRYLISALGFGERSGRSRMQHVMPGPGL